MNQRERKYHYLKPFKRMYKKFKGERVIAPTGYSILDFSGRIPLEITIKKSKMFSKKKIIEFAVKQNMHPRMKEVYATGDVNDKMNELAKRLGIYD